ncbi:hypothetical protein P3T25_005257 [Paraburkholderia sp. GAS32]
MSRGQDVPTSLTLIYGVLRDHCRVLTSDWQDDPHESAKALQWEIDHEAVRRASLAEHSDTIPARSAAEFEIAQQFFRKGVVTALAYRRSDVPRPAPSCPWPVEGKLVQFTTTSKLGDAEVQGAAFRCANRVFAAHPDPDASGAKWRYVVTDVATGQPLKGASGLTAEDAEAAARKFLESAEPLN